MYCATGGIEAMDTAKLTGAEIQNTITGIIEQHRLVAHDIVISRASLT